MPALPPLLVPWTPGQSLRSPRQVEPQATSLPYLGYHAWGQPPVLESGEQVGRAGAPGKGRGQGGRTGLAAGTSSGPGPLSSGACADGRWGCHSSSQGREPGPRGCRQVGMGDPRQGAGGQGPGTGPPTLSPNSPPFLCLMASPASPIPPQHPSLTSAFGSSHFKPVHPVSP